jgi:hypothetical protein
MTEKPDYALIARLEKEVGMGGEVSSGAEAVCVVDAVPHGTVSGYRLHVRRQEEPCRPCRQLAQLRRDVSS